MLFRFDPFNQFDRFDRPNKDMLALDAVRHDDTVYVYFDTPGVDDDDIDIAVEKNTLSVEVSRRWYDTDAKTLTSERPQGTFKREIQLGDNYDTDRIDASLDKGVLTLAIPVKEGTKPRSVSIKTADHETKELVTS